MSHVTKLAMVTALLLGVVGTAPAQRPARPGVAHRHSYKREVPAALLRQAKVSEDSALKIAMARMPGAKVQALELENENGHLMWSWEMKLEGKTGIEEVNVNALDGSIIGVEHENPETKHRDTTKTRPRPQP
jgi:hypothetical protein